MQRFVSCNLCDTIPFAILVATHSRYIAGNSHQPTKITGNDIIDDVIITDDVIGHVTHINNLGIL